MTKDEALKLAFEKVTGIPDAWTNPALMQARNGFIQGWEAKESLAQTQKPVAWLEPEWGEKICPEVGYEVTMTDDHPRDLCWIPLYPHPPQRTEPVCPECKAGVLYECVACSSNNYPPQRTWAGLTVEDAVLAEREACAKLCGDLVLSHPGRADLTADQCAAAIRARGQA
jgi:hypothetical protein